MSRMNSTIWSIEKHTIVKHQILKYYLSAWFPIIASWNKKVLYIDGFAGPGKYSKNEEGSIHRKIALISSFVTSDNGLSICFLI